MRNNQPVTGVELQMRETQSLISRTDMKGKITYVNQDFIEVSGFSEQELVGSPHNIVRHPDMPAEAFDDLWKTLKAGHSWSGMVKNRNKSGDHYWVMANATPIRENDTVIGYTSVRTVPSREQVEQATALYARFKEGRAGGLEIRNGKVRRRGILGKIAGLKELHIRGRLTLALGVLCAMLVIIGVLGLSGLNAANQGMHAVYAKHTMAMGQLDAVIRFLNRESMAMADAISGANPADTESALAHIAESEKQIDAAWRAYMASPLDASEKKLADQFAVDHSAFVARGLAPATAALAAGNHDEAKRLNAEVIRKDFPALRAGIDGLLKMQLDAARVEVESVQSNYVFMRNVVIAALALGILFAFMMRMFLVRVIVQPLRESVDVAKQIAAGNLTAHIGVRSDDEMGQMLQTLDTMRKSLSNIIAEVRRNAESIGSAAGEIAVGNTDLSQRTEEQASTLEETASSMEELTATVKQNADHSKEARELVNAACSIAAQGGVVMGEVVGTMDTIAQSSKKITDIIGVIDGIAFQTNILALNAAVEAARAGEQGRGFAVVASEVRSLAQRSAAAAKEIKDLIGASVANVQNGAQQVSDARDKIDEIVAAVQQVTTIMNDITTASMEQSSGIEQVSQAVMQMDEVTQQNAALVEQAAAAAESLQMQGDALVQGMGVFRLAGDQHVPAARTGAGRPLAAQQKQIGAAKNILRLKSRR